MTCDCSETRTDLTHRATVVARIYSTCRILLIPSSTERQLLTTAAVAAAAAATAITVTVVVLCCQLHVVLFPGILLGLLVQSLKCIMI